MFDHAPTTSIAEPLRGARGRWARLRKVGQSFLAIVGASTLIIGGYTAISGLAGAEETYRRAEAAKFADAYLTIGPLDPGRARDTLTTEAFQDLDQAKDPDYTEWWRTVKAVDVQGVSRTDEKNVFRVDYVLTYTNGREEEVRSLWLLTCVDELRKYLPFFDCSSRALRLDDVSRPPKD
jgi:hypothetical protein